MIYGFLGQILTLLVLCSCASPDKAQVKKPINDYEEEFNPSQYGEAKTSNNRPSQAVEESLPNTSEEVEYITIERVKQAMGYRVQVFSTTSFEDAKSRQNEYEKLVEDSVGIHIVFDAPYYKIRFGDYLQKSQAEESCRMLKGLGLEEAWIVRDKVNYVVTEKIIRH